MQNIKLYKLQSSAHRATQSCIPPPTLWQPPQSPSSTTCSCPPISWHLAGLMLRQSLLSILLFDEREKSKLPPARLHFHSTNLSGSKTLLIWWRIGVKKNNINTTITHHFLSFDFLVAFLVDELLTSVIYFPFKLLNTTWLAWIQPSSVPPSRYSPTAGTTFILPPPWT